MMRNVFLFLFSSSCFHGLLRLGDDNSHVDAFSVTSPYVSLRCSHSSALKEISVRGNQHYLVGCCEKANSLVLQATRASEEEDISDGVEDEQAAATNDNESMTDEELLETVPISKFRDLCQQLRLPTEGTKQDLLFRLRHHAEEQAQLDKERRRDRKVRIEEGANADERERHEILGGSSNDDKDDGLFPFQNKHEEPSAATEEEEEEEEEEGFFYFEFPTDPNSKKEQEEAVAKAKKQEQTVKAVDQSRPEKRPYITQSDVLAPPPPPPSEATIDEDGNRVVQVYSTTDHNDLTGIAAAQPGQAAQFGTDPMLAGSGLGQQQQSQPWDMDNQKNTVKTSSTELEAAKEKVTDLVQTLLVMSGAPAFQHFDTIMPDDDDDGLGGFGDEDENAFISSSATTTNSAATAGANGAVPSTIGFDPAKVPTHLLAETSKALRADRGQVLQEVLRKFEIHAIGQDGMAADNIEDGGGHFREVSKVRAFLEGYRRAEVRKVARKTVTFLLDKLVAEGVQGLDLSLSTMSRSNDDFSSAMGGVVGGDDHDEIYELNDSLLTYLNDVIREQEKKVQQLGSSSSREEIRATTAAPTATAAGKEESIKEDDNDDPIARLWNRTQGEDGEIIESIDPNDPKVSRILQQEIGKEEQVSAKGSPESSVASGSGIGRKEPIPDAAPEKLLLLLTLLRERIKTEAAFAGDERSRNLRLLAYCLQCTNEADREELIINDLGSSIDRLDTFLELVASSIEYAESTSHQLQPSKRMPLNVPLLKSILDLTETIREQSAWKASGLSP